ncbi:MAG: symmetrical bis(5'-nucleosyl)-tetraphosphatase [Glaciecola sp.]
MKNYVVGDIQGCYKGLRKLLKKAQFNPQQDKLWSVGDLIARGPESLETLAYLHDLGEHFDTVLGNHDLHLIAHAHGVSKLKPQDKLDALVKHKHFSRYIDFLLSKPLALYPAKDILISHAGLYPKWSLQKALKMARKVSASLNTGNPTDFLKSMYGNKPNVWSKTLSDEEKLRFSVNALTRMRYITPDFGLEFSTKSHPDNTTSNVRPWFDFHNAKTNPKQTVLFGHWASLLGQIPSNISSPAKVVALDTGYVWGNTMTLYCIETQKLIRVQA